MYSLGRFSGSLSVGYLIFKVQFWWRFIHRWISETPAIFLAPTAGNPHGSQRVKPKPAWKRDREMRPTFVNLFHVEISRWRSAILSGAPARIVFRREWCAAKLTFITLILTRKFDFAANLRTWRTYTSLLQPSLSKWNEEWCFVLARNPPTSRRFSWEKSAVN